MAKLVIIDELGIQLREILLNRARLTIGRAAQNDIVVDHPGASAEHAAIVAQKHDFYLEDLGSTNGTTVNGQPVQKHFLQDGDVIQLATCQLRFEHAAPAACDVEITTASAQVEPQGQPFSAIAPLASTCVGGIRILEGSQAGREITLNKPLTTIGLPGALVAGIGRDAYGYYVLHLEGDLLPRVNGKPVGPELCRLHDADCLEISDTKIVFFITGN